jgi:hypothetical protein
MWYHHPNFNGSFSFKGLLKNLQSNISKISRCLTYSIVICTFVRITTRPSTVLHQLRPSCGRKYVKWSEWEITSWARRKKVKLLNSSQKLHYMLKKWKSRCCMTIQCKFEMCMHMVQSKSKSSFLQELYMAIWQVDQNRTLVHSNTQIDVIRFVGVYQWILHAWIAYPSRFDLQELQNDGNFKCTDAAIDNLWRRMLLALFMLHKMAVLNSNAHTAL